MLKFLKAPIGFGLGGSDIREMLGDKGDIAGCNRLDAHFPEFEIGYFDIRVTEEAVGCLDGCNPPPDEF